MGIPNSIPKGTNSKTMLLSLHLCEVKKEQPFPEVFTLKYITKQIRKEGEREQ